MNKEEFKLFCHEFFTQKGFIKKNKMYYLKGREIMCGIYLQKSIGDGFYVEYNCFIGEFENIKKYPKRLESDFGNRITVLSKATYKGGYYMTALIEYDKYSKEELIPYFEKTVNSEIMPLINLGKKYLLENFDEYLREEFYEIKLKTYAKLTNGKVLYEDTYF